MNSPYLNNRFLIAEDNPAELRLLYIAMEISLLQPFIDITIARDGEEAIKALEASLSTIGFNVLLLDLNMPKVRGTEVLRYIKSKPKPHPLIIVLSNSDHKRDLDECFALGCDGYVVKPSDYRDLVRLCESFRKRIEVNKVITIATLQQYCPFILSSPHLPRHG